ncbi:MAG TPA: enoyl-CoA hydratase/isomerase family protein [Gemmatimonadaceae bacterium]|nr:enoyl-CoA hydratase/isomerase family protein [Gemmatimonadaceae bacterium]
MSGIRTERDGPVGRLVLARPERRNVIDQAMADAMAIALQQLESDARVRVVHLTADGEDFCAGVDLEAIARIIDEPADVQRQDAEALGRVFLALRALMKPVLCSVRGRALGSGAGLAMACDVALAHQDAEFGFPEVRAGAVPAIVMTMLRRTVGEKRAADLVLTGRVIDAEEAGAIGLVSRVLPAATFEADTAAAIQGLTRSSPTSLALTKWLLYKLDALSFEDGIAAGIVTTVESRATKDFRSGLRQSGGERE